MNIDLIILLGVLLLNLGLSLIVLLRNYRKPAHILFALFGASILVWTTFNYLADHASGNNLIFTKLTLFSATFVTLTLLLLSYSFPLRRTISQRTRLLIGGSFVVNGVLCLSSGYIASVTMSGTGVQLTVGTLYPLFLVYILAHVTWSITNFYRQRRRAGRVARSQITMFAAGILVYTSFAILSNAVLPVLLNNWAPSRYGPVFTVPFVAITAYAIVKHRLFDVRSVIARIFAYAATLMIVIILYSLIVVFVVANVVSLNELSTIQLLMLALPTIVCTLTFPYIKSVVDKVTAKIFYRKMYQIREVLDQLSNILITENDVQRMMRSSVRVLNAAIHPSTVYAAILDENLQLFKDYAVGRNTPATFATSLQALSHLKDPVTNRDDHEGQAITDVMDSLEADVVLRLKKGDKLIGFILFGSKKNGSPFTRQDLNLLRVGANNLSVALNNAQQYETIAHFADTLKIEVDHATQKLRHANQKLKSLDKLKDDFISMASHQFRTPAGSIRQALRMIHDPHLTTQDKEEILSLAEANSEQLVSVVNTMLNISRLQAGKFTLDKSLTHLPELVDKVILATGIVAKQKHITLDYVRPDHDLALQVDQAKINEAMKNYIENAIKYSPENSTVQIVLQDTTDHVTFTVRDTGMGVPEQERDHLFGKFYRASNAREQQPDGNGIGLYVVREIAEAHGGSVHYQPENPGSTFGFTLPKIVQS